MIAIVCASVAGLSLLGWAWIFNTPSADNGGGEEMLTIEPGMSVNQVTALLVEHKLISHPRAFRLAVKLGGLEKRILPGNYLVPHGLTNAQLLGLLRIPMIRTKDVTIPEGLTAREIGGILQREIRCDSAEFVAACDDSTLAYQFGLPTGRLEGYLFPDTYNFYLNAPPRAVAERMVDRFFEKVGDSLQIRIRVAGMNLQEAVTLASIIEGEVQIGSEAPLVSAVYHNRLRKRMALMADPTIQYIIPDGPRRLHRSDLAIDSPYNTYKYPGLPPGPINNPGLRSIRAAIEPAKVDYLYFVAQGDGSHAFNREYSGHLESKVKLDNLRRDLDREKKEKG